MATDPLAAAAAAGAPSFAKAVDTYRKAVATAATATAYIVLARGMARELLPHDLRAAASWAASLVRARLEPRPADRRNIIIKSSPASSCYDGDGGGLFDEARQYLATRIDPHSMHRLCLSGGVSGARKVLSMEHGDSMTDVFEGVKFTWASVEGDGRHTSESRELSFDAEHTDMALGKYVPFITSSVEEARRQDRALRIYLNDCGVWSGMSHHHPATFDSIAMDPELKQSVVADLDRFLKRREYYQRIGKAWKRGYLLYGPPGTGKSSLVAAMANYLRFNLYDLDLSDVHANSTLQRLLNGMSNRSILVIEDIDCCFTAASRQASKNQAGDASMDDDCEEGRLPDSWDTHGMGAQTQEHNITLSGLLNFIDGLWSTSGEERIIVFTTNYRERLDPALLRPGRMDMHVYMGYCGWEAFKTLAHNYFLVDDHPMFPEIQGLLAEVEVTPAEVSEMLLRSEDADAALQGVAKFLGEKQAVGEGN